MSLTATRTRTLSSSSVKLAADGAGSGPFLEAVKARRSYYGLENKSPISDDKIYDIVKHTMLHTPSSFNSQSTRAVILLGAEHEKLWRDVVKPAVKAVAPSEMWENTNKKLTGFQNAYGTVLFFEDPKVVAALSEAAPAYADRFPTWSEHTNGMHTEVLWVALEQEGFGANLQHYNPLIDEKVSAEWDIPAHWSLKSQLVFGTPLKSAPPKEKTFKPLEDRLFVYGGKFGEKK